MRLVVIGGVAAGMSAASRARQADANLEIVVLEKSKHVSYGACGLPYFVEGRVRSLRQLQVHSREFFQEERDIAVRLDAEVTSVSPARREVVLAGGERIVFDRLILTTGARRDCKSISGADQPHVFSVDTWNGAERLEEHLRTANPLRAIILGAGYIGLETAEALRARGLQVQIWEASKDVLGRSDPWLTEIVRKQLEQFRVELRLGAAATSIPSADVVILACGLTPNTRIAAEAGVELGNSGAIRVSDRMETSIPGIYAAGDCIETTHLVSGRPVWFPLGTTANKTGRVAGAAAAGLYDRFPGIVGTSIARVCGLGIASTGLSPEQAKQEGFDPVPVQIEALDRARYFRGKPTRIQLTADRRGRLLGGTVIGESGVEGRINVLATALTHRMNAGDFLHLDLAYAPPFSNVWDPLLIAARQLVKLLN